MKESIFSVNELRYIKHKESMEKAKKKNYIYQLRYSIKKKLSNFVCNDLELLLKFNDLLEESLTKELAIKLFKECPGLINTVSELAEVKIYLGEKTY